MYALVLAGGKGERLRPLTDTLPKPMVPLGGKPILEHQVEWLKQAGVTDVVFLVGYLWQTVQDHFQDGRRFGICAHYNVEESPLGRGGAIRQGMSLVPEDEESVLVLNGDIITAEPPATVLGHYQRKKVARADHLATIMVVPMVSPYGLVAIGPQDEVVSFREKAELPYWINAGIYLFDRQIATELPETGDHETETFPRLARAGRMSAVRSRAFWRSVDSFKDLREAEEHITASGRGQGRPAPRH
ncbi:MAG: nucleotidyltransferase family protein [Dehalococcoidia bacterium]|nr:nucleotidyltransferase family protein [Dehalococcoidia bacterium]MSQ16361.1 nucleotidyltransferase family protein [Dehalococcoidia bacterium]